MSSQNENDPKRTPRSRSADSVDTLAAAAPPLPRRISPSNVFLFLDNTQDARSTRSAIQRHTAHHAAAQRREARLQSSRERTPRNLEWQRVPSVDPSNTMGIDPIVPPDVRRTSPDEIDSARQDQANVESGRTASGQDRRRLSSETSQSNDGAPSESLQRPVSSPVLRSVGEDEACKFILEGYQLGLSAQSLPPQNPQHWEARAASLEQVNRGLGILVQRLANQQDSCSDQTIQAVLALLVYAISLQTPEEVASHRAALDKMITLRGGLSNFSHNAILEQQLACYTRGDYGGILRIPAGSG